MQGPRLYRFFNYEMPDYLSAPTAGWNPDAQPWEIPVSQAPQLDNFLLHPGKLVMRGPLVVTADLSTWYPLNLAGVAMTSTGTLLGRKNTSGAGQVDPWNAPLLRAASADLASGLTTGLWVIGGSASTFSFATADSIPGPRWINFDGLLYGISYDSAGSAAADVNGNYFAKPTSLCTVLTGPHTSPSQTAGTYANDASTGTNPWTTGSPNTAGGTIVAQTKTMSSYVNTGAGTVSWGDYETGGITGQPEMGAIFIYNDHGNVTQYSKVLQMTTGGFSIPSNALITGIEATLNVMDKWGSVDNVLGVQLVVGGTPQGTIFENGYVVPTTLTALNVGANFQMWGLSLTPAQVNASNFGVAWWVQGRQDAISVNQEIAVTKATTITVYYSVPVNTEYLKATNFGFALPSSATIQGISVTVTRDANASSNDLAVKLVKGGTIQSTNRSTGAALPSSMTPITFGGATDLWGSTWLYSDINASTFGAVYQAATEGIVSVSSITIKVWWTTGAVAAVTVLSNAPHGAFDLIGYQSRIWLLAGIDTPAAGTTHDPIALFFTNQIVSGGGTASADWKDPVDLTTNKIVMDGDAADFGVGLSVVRNAMIVFRKASVWLLKGSTTQSYALIPISQDLGCVDARSIVESDQGAYFISSEGLMITNGTTVTNVSGSVLHTLQTAIAAEQAAVIAGHGGYVTCGRTSRGQLVVSIGVGAAAGSIAPIFTAMYDPAAAKGGAWVRLTSQLWSNDGSQASGNNYCGQIYDYAAPKRLLAIGDRYITALQDQSVGISMLDYNAGLYDQLPSGANPYVSIPAVWRTVVPAITTSAKRTFGQGKRYYMDYQFAAQGLVPTTGWQMQPFDGAGNSLDNAQSTPIAPPPSLTGFVSGVSPVPGDIITRFNQDFWAEIGDFYFVVAWQDIARAMQAGSSVAEIYGCGIEFQHTRERR
jgi:hypothetical protein